MPYLDKNDSLKVSHRVAMFFSPLREIVLEASVGLHCHSAADTLRKHVKETPGVDSFSGKPNSSSSNLASTEANSLVSNQRRLDKGIIAHLYRGTPQKPLKRGHRATGST